MRYAGPLVVVLAALGGCADRPDAHAETDGERSSRDELRHALVGEYRAEAAAPVLAAALDDVAGQIEDTRRADAEKAEAARRAAAERLEAERRAVPQLSDVELRARIVLEAGLLSLFTRAWNEVLLPSMPAREREKAIKEYGDAYATILPAVTVKRLTADAPELLALALADAPAIAAGRFDDAANAAALKDVIARLDVTVGSTDRLPGLARFVAVQFAAGAVPSGAELEMARRYLQAVAARVKVAPTRQVPPR